MIIKKNLFILMSHTDCTYNITHIKIYNIKQSIPSHRNWLTRHIYIYKYTFSYIRKNI